MDTTKPTSSACILSFLALLVFPAYLLFAFSFSACFMLVTSSWRLLQLTSLTLCIPGGGQICPPWHILPDWGPDIYILDYYMTCKLGPWSYLSFETFLGPIQPLFTNLSPFCHGQSSKFSSVKRPKTLDFGL